MIGVRGAGAEGERGGARRLRDACDRPDVAGILDAVEEEIHPAVATRERVDSRTGEPSDGEHALGGIGVHDLGEEARFHIVDGAPSALANATSFGTLGERR